jgi:hypothetical protein
MDVLSRELGRQKIDKEILDALDLVLRLKTCRNTLAPISRLPTEILSKIFISLAHHFYFHDDDDKELSWIPIVTAVCGHWRAIALECPSLWCLISSSSPIWTEEMLKRSKMAPLVVTVESSTIMRDSIHSALDHISRIKEVHLVASQPDMTELFDRIDKRTAPLLQSLHLENPLPIRVPDNKFTLPETLLVSNRLQRLELVHCNMSWNSPILRNLVHMKLHNTSPPTITELLEALERMPLLETLDLNGSLPVVSSDSFRPLEIKRIVHLSHLETLRLSSTTIIKCAYLLRHISYSVSTSLALHCTLGRNNDISALCNAVSSVWNGTDGSKLLRCLNIKFNPLGYTTLLGWVASGSVSNRRRPREPPQIDVKLDQPPISEPKPQEMIIDICNALTLTNLRTLFVWAVIPIPKATWLNALSNLTSLRTVHVFGQAAFELVLALSTGFEEGQSDDDTGIIFFPNLHNLGLEDMFYNVKFFKDLRDCLMARCHWGAEVRKLHLECTRGYYDQVELLREIVVDVDWVENVAKGRLF